VTEENPVRAIEAFVDALDLAALGFEGAKPERTGRPAYHPATLLKIYLYGYLNRIQSSKRGGNKRTVDIRAVVNGVMYVLSTGCQWSALPKDLPPRSTVNDYFRRWDWDGPLDRIHHALYVRCRERADRDASPTVAIIDSQSVKSAEKEGARSIRPATTQARKSKERSGTSWSTPKGC
jgi:transposase